MYYKDKKGRVYDGLLRRFLCLPSPSLTWIYIGVDKRVFTKKSVQIRALARSSRHCGLRPRVVHIDELHEYCDPEILKAIEEGASSKCD